MHTLKTRLVYQRATKGTFVFATDDPEAAIKTLYIQKDKAPNNPPEALTVTVEAAE